MLKAVRRDFRRESLKSVYLGKEISGKVTTSKESEGNSSMDPVLPPELRGDDSRPRSITSTGEGFKVGCGTTRP